MVAILDPSVVPEVDDAVHEKESNTVQWIWHLSFSNRTCPCQRKRVPL